MTLIPFSQRFFVAYATRSPAGEAGYIAVDRAADHPDASARADWYARRDPDRNYTVILVVDLDAAALLDAHVDVIGSAFDRRLAVRP